MGGGGSTSTSGTFAPEVRGLFNSSSNALIKQQNENPLGQYNFEHPLDVAGTDPFQQMGAQLIGGGANPTGLDALTLQSILRMPGLAGAGPTTGQYDYGNDPGLQDIMQFLNPSFASSPSANDYRGSNPAGPFSHQTGAPAPETDLSGLDQALAPNPPQAGAGAGAGGQTTPAGSPGTPPGAPGAASDEGAQFYKDWNGQLRRVETGNAGRHIGIAGHGQAQFGDDGFLNPLYEQGSQGLATTPNQQRERFGRVWDSSAADGTPANASWQHPNETMSLQDLISHGGADAAQATAFQNRFGTLPTAANNWGRGSTPAPAAPAAAASAPTAPAAITGNGAQRAATYQSNRNRARTVTR